MSKTPEEMADIAEEWATNWERDLDDSDTILKQIPAAAAPQWISVKDRLPVPHHAVMWCLIDNLMAIGSFDYDQRGIFIDSCFFKLKEATHWMPLPELPKEEK
jgi:hypothetical protein